jgi:transposase InsO family protein
LRLKPNLCRPYGARLFAYAYPPLPARVRSPSGWANYSPRLRRWIPEALAEPSALDSRSPCRAFGAGFPSPCRAFCAGFPKSLPRLRRWIPKSSPSLRRWIPKSSPRLRRWIPEVLLQHMAQRRFRTLSTIQGVFRRAGDPLPYALGPGQARPGLRDDLLRARHQPAGALDLLLREANMLGRFLKQIAIRQIAIRQIAIPARQLPG